MPVCAFGGIGAYVMLVNVYYGFHTTNITESRGCLGVGCLWAWGGGSCIKGWGSYAVPTLFVLTEWPNIYGYANR